MNAKSIVGMLIMKIFGLLPIDEKKVVFCSFMGRFCNDNPGAIFDEMKKVVSGYKYIWLMENDKIKIEGATVVKIGSIAEFYHLATSKVWIDNFRKRPWTVKRKRQIYVQTWHDGGFPMKKVEGDAIKSLPTEYIMGAKHDSNITDYFLSGCEIRSRQYRRAFWFNKEILKFGMPATDMLYFQSKKIIEKVRNLYRVVNNTKIVLYAPTFRTGKELEEWYTIDLERVLMSLKKRWGCDWILFVRMHPNLNVENFIFNNNIVNVSDYPILNELIISSDMIISDYSGVIGSAMEAGKIVVLYASDYEEYQKERSTYFEFYELPFPYAFNNDDLEKMILEFDYNDYKQKVLNFMEKCGYYKNNGASKQCANFIIEKMKEK